MSVTAADRRHDRQFAHVRTGRAVAAIRGALWSILSVFAPAAVSALVFTLTSRVLGPAEFGLVALAGSIGTLGSALVPAGYGESLVQRSDVDGRHLDVVFWLCLGTGCAVYAALAFAAAPLSSYLGHPQLLPLVLVLGTRVFFDILAVVPNALLARSMAFKWLAVRTTIASLSSGAVCLGLLSLGFGIWALALSLLAASVAASLSSMISAHWRPRLSFDLAALRQLSRFGFFASANRAIGLLSLDQVLIGLLLGPATLGIYGFARRIFQILSDLIGGALGSVSFALLSSLQDEHGKLKRAFLFATFASSAISFPLFMGLAAVAGELVPLAFGAHWIEAVPVVQAFCLLGLITSIGVLQSSLVRGMGYAGLWFWYILAKQVLTMFYVLLFHGWGVVSLVNAIVIQSYAMWIPALYLVAATLRMSILSYLAQFLPPLIATIVMLAGVQLLAATLTGADMLTALVAKVCVGAIVYTAALALLARRRLLELFKAIVQLRGEAGSQADAEKDL